jgi:hypothetical protein
MNYENLRKYVILERSEESRLLDTSVAPLPQNDKLLFPV